MIELLRELVTMGRGITDEAVRGVWIEGWEAFFGFMVLIILTIVIGHLIIKTHRPGEDASNDEKDGYVLAKCLVFTVGGLIVLFCAVGFIDSFSAIVAPEAELAKRVLLSIG